MNPVNLADAKAALVVQAKAEESVCSAIGTPRRPIALSALRALTTAMPKQDEAAGDLVRKMRDESRY